MRRFPRQPELEYSRRGTPKKLLQLGLQLLDQLRELLIIRIDLERAVKFFKRFLQHPVGQIDPAQVDVRKMTRLVSFGRFGALEPRNRVIELLLMHQFDTNSSIGIANVTIELYGLTPLSNRLVEPSEKAIGQPYTGMPTGGGINRDRFLIEFHGLVEFARHLMLHR